MFSTSGLTEVLRNLGIKNLELLHFLLLPQLLFISTVLLLFGCTGWQSKVGCFVRNVIFWLAELKWFEVMLERRTAVELGVKWEIVWLRGPLWFYYIWQTWHTLYRLHCPPTVWCHRGVRTIVLVARGYAAVKWLQHLEEDAPDLCGPG